MASGFWMVVKVRCLLTFNNKKEDLERPVLYDHCFKMLKVGTRKVLFYLLNLNTN